MKDRLKAIIEEKELTAAEFAASIDANPSAISHLLKGRNKPGYDLLVNIANAFPDINMYWLLTGKGEMYSGTENAEKKETAKDAILNPKIKENNEPQQPYKAASQKELKRIVLFFADGSFEDYYK